MKKALKKVIAVILIISFFYCTPYASEVSAEEEMTVESARQQIANWGIAFKSSEGSKWRYTTNFPARGATYRGGYPQSTYNFDCVGCVSYIVHYSIGITYSLAETGDSGFATPQSNVRDTSHFELHYISSSDSPGVGDILIATRGQNGSTHNHVAIYCGNGVIVDIISSGSTHINTVNSNWEENESSGCIFSKFARLKSIDGASFTPIEGGNILPIEGINGGTGSSGGSSADTDVVDLDEVAKRFKYQGMPTDISYSTENVFRWIFDEVAGFLDYLIGIILSLIRIPIVGLTSIVERLINSVLHSVNV